jgi:5-methylcytosine-specific restriction endonuclease McrA
MPKIKYSRPLIENIVLSSLSVKECLSKMGIERTNGTSSIFYNLIKKYNIDISHFVNIKLRKSYQDKELFIQSSQCDRSTVKNRIIKNNIIPYICSECGCDNNWKGKKMSLILDHINGINNDNRLENLRFLCPNCDSIQDTYKNKNKNSSKEKVLARKKIQLENIKHENFIKKQNYINFMKNKILESKVDFSKKTWGVEVSKILNKTPQYSLKWVKKHMKEYLI